MSTKLADIYLRLSLDKTGEGVAVERQERECRDLADRLGFTIRQVFVDNDLSASSGVMRPAFEELLLSTPPAIVTWHTDRLIRLTSDLERVIALGVNVHAVTAGHLDLSTPAGRAVARTVTAWATYEGEQKAERQRAAHRQRVRSGRQWWTTAPFGYDMDAAIVESEAAVIRKLYADVIAGMSMRSLAAELNDRGVSTRRGSPWHGTSLRRMLVNPRYAGFITYQGEEAGPASWEPIVEEDTYRQAARILKTPSRTTKVGAAPTGLLTGIAHCGKCGGAMGRSRNGRRKGDGGYRIYSCRLSDDVTYREEFVDAVVESEVVHRLASMDVSSLWAKDQATDAEVARAEVVRLREALDAIVEDFSDGHLTRAQMLAGTERTRTSLEAADARLHALTRGSELAGLVGVKDVRAAWKARPPERKRAALQVLVKDVVIAGRKKGVRRLSVDDIDVQWA